MADPLFRNSPYQDKPRSRSTERSHTERRSRHGESPASSPSGLLAGARSEKERESSDDSRPAPAIRPQKPPTRSSKKEVDSTDEPESRTAAKLLASAREHLSSAREHLSDLANQLTDRLAPAEHKVALGITVVALILVGIGLAGMFAGSKTSQETPATPPWEHQGSHGNLRPGHRHGSATSGHSENHKPAGPLQPLPQCSDMVPCPVEWRRPDHEGGYFCLTTGKCQTASIGRFPSCDIQCHVGALKEVPPTSGPGETDNQGSTGNTVIVIQGSASTEKDKALTPLKLEKSGAYDLRVIKGGKMIGCAAPIGLFPGQPKYGCGGNYSTATSCDAANFPVKDTKYVAAVHQGCETEAGRGTYGYAYDDGVGLKQCAPVAKYEWVLCPTGREGKVEWEAEAGRQDTTKRFRVTNKCDETIWIQQAGAEDAILKHDSKLVRLEAGNHYTYSIPNRGFPSTRFLPKTGCDSEGNSCDIQSMPPCPPQGCDLPVDTKFEASWGCVYATGIPYKDSERCALTGQGNPSTYQDWWDGSAVDGWTLPFSVLVDDAGHGLAPGDTSGSPAICGPVVCADLKAEKLCPREEYLTPTA